MRKSVVLLSIAFTLSLIGCRKPVTPPSLSEMSFELETKEVRDGEDFAFIVYSNHPKLRITEFSCPLAPKMVTLDKEYDVTDGRVRFSQKVSVKETNRGRLSLTVEDVATGATKSFSAVYTTIGTSTVSLSLENVPITSPQLQYGYPVIVSGDDVVLTFYSSEESLILEDFSFEFNDGSFVKGNPVEFVSDGSVYMKEFRFPAITFEKESPDFAVPSKMSFRFHDETTGEDIETEPVSYLKVFPLEVHGTIEPEVVIDGQPVTVKIISDNRKTFTVTGYEGEIKFSDFDNSTTKKTSTGVLTFSTDEASVKTDHDGELVFYVEDSEYTLRKAGPVHIAYKAEEKAAPGSFVVSNGAFFRVNEYEGDGDAKGMAEFTVESDNAAADNRFVVKVESSSAGEVKVEPSTIISDGRFTVYGGSQGGDVTLRVESVKDPNVYTFVKGYVRHTVGLQVNGEFEDIFNRGVCPHQMNGSRMKDCFAPENNTLWLNIILVATGLMPLTGLTGIKDNIELQNYLNSEGYKVTGWYGMPKSLSARLVTWSRKKDNAPEFQRLNPQEVDSYYKFTPFNGLPHSTFAVTTRINAGNEVSSYWFYKNYRDKTIGDEGGTKTAVKESDSACCLYLMTNPHDSHRYKPFVSQIVSKNLSYIEHFANVGTSCDLTQTLQILQDWNTLVKYVDRSGSSWLTGEVKFIDRKYDSGSGIQSLKSEWGSLSFNVSDVEYDKDCLNLKYIFYQYKIDAESATDDSQSKYWWSDLDNTSWVEVF